MRRLTINAIPTDSTELGTEHKIAGGDDGLTQIDDFARALAAESGVDTVAFEVLWPWEDPAADTFDALTVDTTLLGTDRDGEARRTLPPYAELSAEQRSSLGLA